MFKKNAGKEWNTGIRDQGLKIRGILSSSWNTGFLRYWFYPWE